MTVSTGGPTAEQIKAFHRKFVTGVTVVTATADGEPRGLVVNAFTSVTVSPPTVLVCIAKSSSTHDTLFGAQHFAVNLLAHDQQSVAERFATKSGNKFAELDWRTGEQGCPILGGACAYLEAAISARARTATHTVFFGRVLNAHSSDAAPLIYAGSRFFDGATLEKLP